MPVTIDGTNGITTPTYGGTDTSEYLKWLDEGNTLEPAEE